MVYFLETENNLSPETRSTSAHFVFGGQTGRVWRYKIKPIARLMSQILVRPTMVPHDVFASFAMSIRRGRIRASVANGGRSGGFEVERHAEIMEVFFFFRDRLILIGRPKPFSLVARKVFDWAPEKFRPISEQKRKKNFSANENPPKNLHANFLGSDGS